MATISEFNGLTSNIVIKSDKETECFEYIVRAQLVPSMSRTDVYFAKDEIFGHCFVKGPYISGNEIKNHSKFYLWKKENNIIVPNYYFVNLYPNRWSEGTGLGQRNKCDRNKKYLFMVTESLLGTATPRIITRDIDLEIEEKQKKTDKDLSEKKGWKGKIDLLESDKTWVPISMWKDSPDSVKQDFVTGMIVRSMIGAVDLADKNFVLKSNRLYSIDEDAIVHTPVRIFHEKSVWKRYGYDKFKMIFNYLGDNFDHFYNWIQSWTVLKDEVDYTKFIKDYFDELKEMKNKKDMWDMHIFMITKKETVVKKTKEDSTPIVKKTKKDSSPIDEILENKISLPFVGYKGTKSAHGHSDDVLISAIHKYNRRNMPEKFIYVLSQLCTYLDCPETKERKSHITHIANRLVISTLEDASTSFHLYIKALNCYYYMKKFNSDAKGNGALVWNQETKENMANLLSMYVYECCKSKKSRIPSCMSILSYLFSRPVQWLQKYEKDPEYNVGGYITKTLNLIENKLVTIEHFMKSIEERTEDCILMFRLFYETKTHPLLDDKNFIPMLCKKLNLNENLWMKNIYPIFKGRKNEGFMPGAVLLSRYIYEESNKNEYNQAIAIDQTEVNKLKNIFLSSEKMDLDSFVADKHTSRGGSMKKFVEEGSVVTNISDIIEVQNITKLYQKLRLEKE